jgi:hypothetical protein
MLDMRYLQVLRVDEVVCKNVEHRETSKINFEKEKKKKKKKRGRLKKKKKKKKKEKEKRYFIE